MTQLFRSTMLRDFMKIPVRYHKSNHWSVLKKKKTPKDQALKHFDEFYATVYGKMWTDARAALLSEKNKYVAVVNNFSDVERTKSDLEMQGAMDLRSIYTIYKDKVKDTKKYKKMETLERNKNKIDEHMSTIISESHASIFPKDYDIPKPINVNETDEKSGENDQESIGRLKSIETDLNEVEKDKSRIIDASVSLSHLVEYVPATKIKGLEDWVLDSDHYSYYTQSSDFEITVQKDPILLFPEHLHVYAFKSTDTMFKSPKKGSTGVLDYYLYNGASVLPVLALDLKLGDTVLDMCAAPGGKTLSILQTLMPRVMVANDVSQSRVSRIHKIIDQFIGGMGDWEDKLFITHRDARNIDEQDMYNKILVDVPCTTDRHALHSDENSLFKQSRIRERLRIPELQSEILIAALKIIPVGGTVVYATCSLSPIQNDGVVQMALKRVWQDLNITMVVKDMTMALYPLRCLYEFGDKKLKYGHVVVPTLKNNWGPTYFCKLVRVR